MYIHNDRTILIEMDVRQLNWVKALLYLLLTPEQIAGSSSPNMQNQSNVYIYTLQVYYIYIYYILQVYCVYIYILYIDYIYTVHVYILYLQSSTISLDIPTSWESHHRRLSNHHQSHQSHPRLHITQALCCQCRNSWTSNTCPGAGRVGVQQPKMGTFTIENMWILCGMMWNSAPLKAGKKSLI